MLPFLFCVIFACLTWNDPYITTRTSNPSIFFSDFINYENDYFDKSLLRQAFDLIAAAKHEGISQTDLARELGQHKLTTRTLVRNIMKMNVITSYMTDEGRQRITKYILPKYTQKQDKYVQDLVDLYNSQPTQPPAEPKAGTSGVIVKSEFAIRAPVVSSDEPSLLEPVTRAASPEPAFRAPDPVALDHSEYSYHRIQPDDIHTTITITNHMPGINKQASGIGKAILRNTLPSRYIKRCTMIRNMVRDHKIKDPLDLQKEIMAYEKAQGEKHNICKKSCYRLLDKLAVDNFIRIALVNFRYRDKEKLKVFVCDTDVTEADARLHTAIRLQKVTIFCNSIEKDRSSVKRPLKEESGVEEPVASTSAAGAKKRKKEAGVLSFSMAPKFFKMKTFHEYAFSMIYEQDTSKPLDRAEVVPQWQAVHGSVDFDELLREAGDIYSADIGWRMFVPPLPYYDDYPAGWALLSDLVARLPLSVFVNVNNLFKFIPNLSAYLDHPIKRHFLVRNLPSQLRNDLYHKRKYLFSIDEIVRNLCFTGLLQFGTRRLVIKDQIYVYVNRHASFLDTTLSEPSYNTVTPADYPVRTFTFNRTADLVAYWSELQTVCTATKLNKRDTAVGKEIVLHTLMSKPELQPYLEQRTAEQALANDNGHLPGDNLGAGGLDSAFFAHLKKNWTKTKFKCTVDPGSSKKRLDRISKKSVEYGRLKKDINKRYFRTGGLTAPKKVRLRPIAGMAVVRKRRAPGMRTRKIQSRKQNETNRRLPMYDDIDKDALRIMMKLRVDWQPYEDNNLLLCRVAMKYFSPGGRKQYLTGHQVGINSNLFYQISISRAVLVSLAKKNFWLQIFTFLDFFIPKKRV
jgi:general transcription factor 3C polypeptide 1